MRVLHVVPTYEPAFHTGGVVRSTSQLCRALAQQGIEVSVYTTDYDGGSYMDVQPDVETDVGGVSVTYFHCDSGTPYRYSRALSRACHDRIRDFDLLHMTSFWAYPGLAAGREARRAGVPYVMSPRGTLMQAVLRQSGLTKKLAYVYAVERRNLLGASAIHFTAEKERLNTRILRCNRRGVVVPNMVDLQEFAERPPRDVARHGLGLAPQAAIIAYLGRLHDRKGIDLLIQGFRMLADEDKDARLVIAGPDDGAEAKLRALVSALELQTQVLFMGYLDMRQKKDLLVASDITALVSHPGDNFGQSAAESLAMGTPVLLSENVCIAEDLAKDGAAVAVPTDGDAIGRTLIRLMLDKELLRRMGDQGAESVRRRYSPEVVTRQMLDVYRRVLTCGVAPHDSVPSRRI